MISPGATNNLDPDLQPPQNHFSSGRLYCFATEGFGPVNWGLYAGDSHNTRNAVHAYEYGQRPHGYQRQWRPKYE